MDISNINGFFREPGRISADQIGELRELVKEYPWCSSFQVMLAKALREGNDPAFEKQLKKTAVYAGDRKVLYRLIMQPALQKSIADFEEMAALPEEEFVAPEAPLSPPDTVEEPIVEKEEVKASLPENAEEKVDPQQESEPEDAEQPESLDSTNLEREVLKEVAAHSYYRELEQSLHEMKETVKNSGDSDESPASEEKSHTGPLSFVDFISGGKQKDTQVPETVEEHNLIERFIRNEPKIERKKSNFFSPVNMGRMSIVDNDEIVSETLATVYAKQGDIEKARRAYKQLALKYPEKSSYFADLIKNLDQPGSKK